MDRHKDEIIGYQIDDDRRLGEGGFLVLRRLRLRALRADGTASAPFPCDYVERPKGLDAVVVGLYHRPSSGPPLVLLRAGQRPPIILGRDDPTVPYREPPRPMLIAEVVAGLIERGDEGDVGVRRRAAAEVWEEAGFRVPPEAFEPLGPPVYPSPGLCPEKLHFYAAAVDPAAVATETPEGDGSAMEEGARQTFVPLPEALERCRSGAIQDGKTELLLRRLAEHLGA